MSVGAVLSRTSNYFFRKLNFNYKFWHADEHSNWDDVDAALTAIASSRGILGAWTNSLAVLVGDRRVDTASGNVYTALVAHTTPSSGTFADSRTANPTYWALDNVADNSITLAKLVDIATQSFLGRTTASTGDPEVLTAQQARDILGLMSNGQCRLNYLSTTSIRLDPFNGNRLMVADRPCSIPSAGVTLAPTGLTPATNYFVYATDSNSDGVIDLLEASATAYITDTTTGVPIKTGDRTRTLVGFIRPVTGPNFSFTAASRLVRSYYNRRPLECNAALTANRSITSATFTLVHAESTVEWLQWADEAVSIAVVGNATSAGAVNVQTGVGLDSTTTAQPARGSATNANGEFAHAVAGAILGVGNEGNHSASILGASSGVSSTWQTGTSIFVNTR